MKGATEIYAFLVTIGKDVEDAATSCMDSGDHLLGYLLDRAGSFAVESLAKNTEDALRRALAPKDLSVSMRFSPGYCDWPVEEQFKLIKIIDFAKAGVTLTKSCVMIPKKSISAVVGIGPKELFAKAKSPCALCNMKVCDYRRKD
jgi:cobalamin-dependent methionine synthase I